MKYKYVGDCPITLKSPCPQSGKRVDLNRGDTVELDWKPGGHAQTLILVAEEAPKVAETPKVEAKVVEDIKPKTKTFYKKKKKKD